jgi:hypothetical protein
MSEQEEAGTPFSFSYKLPPPDDRRTGPRYTTLLRVGVLQTEAGRELCLIRNISAGGLMAHVYSEIAVGARAEVELKSGQHVSGTVIWAKKRAIGVQFDGTVDVADLLTVCSSGPRPRMPRIEADCFASVRAGARTYRARTRDISQGGVKVKIDAELPIGEAVVTLSGLRPVSCAIRWSDGEFAGIAFNEIVPLGELIPWLKERGQARATRDPAGGGGNELAA